MADTKGDTPKKQQQQPQQPPPQLPPQPSSPVVDPLDESPDARQPPPAAHHLHQPQPSAAALVVTGSTFISAPLFIPAIGTGAAGTTPSPFEQFEVVNPKRPRFGQWKLLASPTSHQLPTKQPSQMAGLPAESSPSPTHNIPQAHVTTASSSDTASSPITHSPIPGTGAGHEASKPEGGGSGELPSFHQQHHPQFRKGKYVSPVWKPNEMLWLARAWRIQYQGGSTELDTAPQTGAGGDAVTGPPGRGKTRAEKDREVAEFLNRHGVNRDAKTAGTKWDNMLGEFRKVYEWERGGEREHVGKSYFRLSPYERKIHRLPASFDEEVFEELSQFMGARMRTPQSRVSSFSGSGDGGRLTGGLDAATLGAPPPPPPFKDDELPLTARAKQLAITGGVETYLHGSGRGGLLLGYEPTSTLADAAGSSTALGKELHRIGKLRMTWEESVSLWAEEGEQHRGRVRLQGCMSFLNADELTFFDEALVACPMEAFEDGPLKGFSVDRFVPGQQIKVFGRRKSASLASASGLPLPERMQLPLVEPSVRSIPPWEFQDPSDYYVGCLRIPPPTLPSLFELSWYLQEPPPEELRFPLRRDVYRDLPQGKEAFFTTSHEPLDCRAFTSDILSPIVRSNPGISITTASSRDSFIGLWDDCINRAVAKFCAVEIAMIRKHSCMIPETTLQDQWPNVTGFLRNFCLWRGEETDQLRDGSVDPSATIVEKLLWTFAELPYLLGYYAVGYTVTFCSLSRSQDRIIRTDLYSLDLSSPSNRMKALIPCYRIAGLLALLGDRCYNSMGSYKLFPYSDFQRIDLGSGNVIEMTPRTVTRVFPTKRKWAAVKEIYDFLDQRVPHAEFITQSLEKDLGLVFKPRGVKCKPASFEQLVEALMYVTKALVALHDLSFMHRDLSWDKVVRRSDNESEWVVCGFDEAAAAPQIYPHGGEPVAGAAHAPEMGRGLHNVKVDVWGVGYLVKTCGLNGGVPKLLRELQNRCLDPNPEHRPTAADCYHHLLQLQSAFHSTAPGGVGASSGGVTY